MPPVLRLPCPSLAWRPFRLLPALLALLLLTAAPALALLGGAAPAQAASTGSAAAAASEERMALYQKLAAVNYCVARASGLADEQALPLAAETIAVILRNEHGSRIARVGEEPLSGEVLMRGSAELTLLGAHQLCPASVPEEVTARLEAIAPEPPSSTP